MSEENLSNIQKKINEQNKIGWPSVFQPDTNKCPKCKDENITKLQTHQGSTQAYLLTRDMCKPVTFRVQKCKRCSILIQADHPLCLNIGDNLMVTLDVLFLMQTIVHTTGPPSTAAEIVLRSVKRSCAYLSSKTTNEEEWICRRLTAGYFALEALDNDEETSQICAFCGVIPEITLSDGGEDICTTLQDVHLQVTPGYEDGIFTSLQADNFTDRLKIFHIEALVFPALHFKRQFKCNISNTPPFLLKSYRGTTLVNTESQKQTKYLEAKLMGGDQQLLTELIEQNEFKISDVSGMTKQNLETLMLKIGFTRPQSNAIKSNVQKKKAVMDLYESVVSGYR